MNYYKRHLGDYAKDTKHLTTYQHGVYAVLLDWYYSSEKPIPLALAYRIVQARSGPEKRSCDEVLETCFDLSKAAGFAHNKRADIDIAKYRIKSAANSLIAIERETTKRDRSVVETCAERSTNAEPSHKPLTTSHKEAEAKAFAQPAASRFGEWWGAYPKKVGRKKAEQLWGRRKLDAIADRLVADVLHRAANDDGWQRGYAPDPCTYINQDRWDDDLRAAPLAAITALATSKTLTGMKSLQEMKNGLVHERDHRRPDEAHVLELGQDACRRLGADHGADLD